MDNIPVNDQAMFRMPTADNGVTNCDIPLQRVENNLKEQQPDIHTILIVATREAADIDEFSLIDSGKSFLLLCIQFVVRYTQQAPTQRLSALCLPFRCDHVYSYQRISYYTGNKMDQETLSALLFVLEADK